MVSPLIEPAETAERGRDGPSNEALIQAAEDENAKIMRQLLSSKTSDKFTRNSVCGKALILSARKGYINIVKFLLQCKVNVEYEDDGGYPALGWAAFDGHVEIVQLLLDAGAKINTKGKEQHDNTPLTSAVHAGQRIIVRVLLHRRADTEATDKIGWTALHWAVELGHCDTVRLLIDAGADTDARECNGRTPLHIACEHGHEDIVRIILYPEKDGGDTTTKVAWAAEKEKDFLENSRGRANIDCRDANGRAAVHVAARYGHIHIVRMCLKCGADAESTDPHKVSVLMYAVHGGNPAVVAEVVSHRVNINVTDYKGRTALCWAVQLMAKGNKVKMREIIEILQGNHVAPQSVPYNRKTLYPVVRRIASGASNLVLFLAILTTIYSSCQQCVGMGEAPV